MLRYKLSSHAVPQLLWVLLLRTCPGVSRAGDNREGIQKATLTKEITSNLNQT